MLYLEHSIAAPVNIFNQYSEEEVENFRCIFEMFDKEKTGFIGVPDLQTIMRSLGRDPNEAAELMQSLEVGAAAAIGTQDEETEGRINFEEFLKLMKNLENRLVSGGGEGTHDNDDFSPREATLDERNKYGSLLPRTGVHFLPDPKVVDFLKYYIPLLIDYFPLGC